MTDTDQEREDEVLKRMLKTPHKPHKGKGLTPESHSDSRVGTPVSQRPRSIV